MALTGTKICAVCGNEFKGAGNICKDGYYCNECEKIIRRIFPEDEEDYLMKDTVLSGMAVISAAIVSVRSG